MYDDLIEYPHLDERIFMCLARRNKGKELLGLFERYCDADESMFEATEASFFEACLLLDAAPALEARILEYARCFVQGTLTGQSGREFGKASALICLYWFGLKGCDLVNLFSASEATLLPTPVARSWLAVVTARNKSLLNDVQARLVGHSSDDVARLSRFLSELISGNVHRVGNYKHQKSRWPLTGKFYDARAWLQCEIISRAGAGDLLATAKNDLEHFAKLVRTRQEQRLLSRLHSRSRGKHS